MKPVANLILLSVLAAPALAQSHSEPRTPRPIPFQSSVKVDAPPVVAVEAPTRPPRPDDTGSAPARRKPFATGEERARVAGPELDRVYYTTQLDGSTWASGKTYKARFGPGGATYVPFLGPEVPRSFPLEMSLASATVDGTAIPLEPAMSAVRDGDRVVIDRGMIDEVYELALDSVEQTFVVAQRPAAGDLRLVVRLESEMSRSESADGFRWSNEHGSVHYSRAFVREADGHRVPVASRLVEGGVEIVVGREYLAGASFPLVVDPVVTTFSVETDGTDTYESDVSYDLTTNRYLVVYERNFTLTDGDILAQLRNADGSSAAFQYLDNTGENWRAPQCANQNAANKFLMVAQAANVLGASNWNIWGMTIDAVTFVAGWKTLISTTDQSGPKYLGDVGGDSYDGPGDAYFCVTWRRDWTVTDWDIHARLVTAQGTLVGSQTLMIDNSGATRDSWPSISKSNGVLCGAAGWTIAWHREVTPTDYDIWSARLSWDGLLQRAPTGHLPAAGLQYYPRASSPLNDGREFIVYGVDYGPDTDLHYFLINTSGGLDGAAGLTNQEQGDNTYQDQIEYSVDSDGERFVVAYAENWGTSTFDYDIWVSTFAPMNVAPFGVRVAESHRSLDFSTAQSLRTDVIAQRSGGAYGSTRFYVSWDSTGSGGHDVHGGLYDRPIGGGVDPFCYGTATQCPCGNVGGYQSGCANSQNSNGAVLSTTGNAQTGPADSLTFTVTGVPSSVTCTLFQGTLGSGGNTFGDGVRCVTGTQVRIRSKFADAFGSATWPTGAEADVSATGLVPLGGAQRTYQVSYRNSAVYCTSATFNISSGLRVLWMP